MQPTEVLDRRGRQDPDSVALRTEAPYHDRRQAKRQDKRDTGACVVAQGVASKVPRKTRRDGPRLVLRAIHSDEVTYRVDHPTATLPLFRTPGVCRSGYDESTTGPTGQGFADAWPAEDVPATWEKNCGSLGIDVVRFRLSGHRTGWLGRPGRRSRRLRQHARIVDALVRPSRAPSGAGRTRSPW